MTSAIVDDYTQRAANQPQPAGWASPMAAPVEHSRDEWERLTFTATPHTFFADVSEYQAVVNSRYPYPVFAFRVDNGGRLDYHAQANWDYVEKHDDHIRVALVYNVFIPRQSGAILHRLKNAFGSQCPPPFCPMTDMESGAEFAGGGNHSSEANDFVSALAEWCGSGGRARQVGYANSPDWSNNWPNHPSWMKRTLANYSSVPGVPSGFYARQYYGALPYGVPGGYPTACAPFGSYVDMNVIMHSTSDIVNAFGLGRDWLDTVDKNEMKALIESENKQLRAQVAADTERLVAAALTSFRDGKEYAPFTRRRHPNLLAAGQSLRTLFGRTSKTAAPGSSDEPTD